MKIILFMNTLLVIATLVLGMSMTFKEKRVTKVRLKKILRVNTLLFIPLMLVALAMLVPDVVYAATEVEPTQSSSSVGLGYLAAAISTGLATIGAGYAVGAVGSSALGAVSEDPRILGKTLIFVGLAEGIAIYGLIISILIIGRL